MKLKNREHSFGDLFLMFPKVGLDEVKIRAYIRYQEREDERYDQMKLNVSQPHRVAHSISASLRP